MRLRGLRSRVKIWCLGTPGPTSLFAAANTLRPELFLSLFPLPYKLQ
jgi:hypothetical protein